MASIKILHEIDTESALIMLFHPEAIPEDVYVDMHDGRLMPARRFFRECLEALTEEG